MKDLIIKYLFLGYRAKVFGQDFYFPRAVSVIVPIFCVAIFLTIISNDIGLVFWAVFTALILLTFPILKVDWLNWGAVAIVPLLVAGSYFLGYNWWEPLPLFYFSLGVFVSRTRFLFLSVTYSDLKEWEQKLQYLRLPDEVLKYDEHQPVFEERRRVLRKFEELEEIKYGANDNVNVGKFLIPFASIILLIILLIIFQGSIERFPDVRGF